MGIWDLGERNGLWDFGVEERGFSAGVGGKVYGFLAVVISKVIKKKNNTLWAMELLDWADIAVVNEMSTQRNIYHNK